MAGFQFSVAPAQGGRDGILWCFVFPEGGARQETIVRVFFFSERFSTCVPASVFTPPPPPRKTRVSRALIAAFGVFLTPWAAPVLAGETVTIDFDVAGGVVGNFTPPYPVVGNFTQPYPVVAWPPSFLPPDGNTVIVNSGTTSGSVIGAAALATGSDSATATGNRVTIGGGIIDGHDGHDDGDVFGGYSQGDSGSATANGNTVTITSGTVGRLVYGGYSRSYSGSATANGNTVTITSGTVDHLVFGGHSESSSGSATANGNTVTITSGTTGHVSGGESWNYFGDAATANDNTVTITGGTINGTVYGGGSEGYSDSATANGNTVVISGGTIAGNGMNVGSVVGGYAEGGGAGKSSDATGNTVIITGGALNGNVYGGYSLVDVVDMVDSDRETGRATGNTVTLAGSPTFDAPPQPWLPTFTNGMIYGGFVGNDMPWLVSVTTAIPGADAFSGNTLNVGTSGLTVNGLHNFENLNFYVPANQTAAQIGAMLTVTGTANLTDGDGASAGTRSSRINVGIAGGASPLRAGDTITLIDAGTLVTNSSLNTTANGQGMNGVSHTNAQGQTITVLQGVTLKYEFALEAANNLLTATVTGIGS
ncbi:MAG: hypothetical protein LBI87_14700, partial [Candidatus Accumulibacter sp.]|nr:hypothetical protein [Accumulibacter sp.]